MGKREVIELSLLIEQLFIETYIYKSKQIKYYKTQEFVPFNI